MENLKGVNGSVYFDLEVDIQEFLGNNEPVLKYNTTDIEDINPSVSDEGQDSFFVPKHLISDMRKLRENCLELAIKLTGGGSTATTVVKIADQFVDYIKNGISNNDPKKQTCTGKCGCDGK